MTGILGTGMGFRRSNLLERLLLARSGEEANVRPPSGRYGPIITDWDCTFCRLNRSVGDRGLGGDDRPVPG